MFLCDRFGFSGLGPLFFGFALKLKPIFKKKKVLGNELGKIQFAFLLL